MTPDIPGAAPLDDASPMPLYHQLYLQLRVRILDGSLPGGARIPSEQSLAARYSVSRITAKRALDELAAAGLVARQRGRGTHVIHGQHTDVLRAPLQGMLEKLDSMARTTRARLLSYRHAPPPVDVATLLDIGADEPVVAAVRVRSLRDIPFAHLSSWTRARPERFSHERLREGSRLGALRASGIRLGRMTQDLGACGADADVARHLHVTPGTPLLELRRLSFGLDEQPVDFLIARYHPERFRFHMSMTLDEHGDCC